MWIHEHQNWPHFTWDEKVLAPKLADIRHRQGRLLGRMESLGFQLRREASLKILTDDVVKSFAIEGDFLNPEEVRSSIARKLGMDIAGLIPASRDIEGFTEMMLDATQRFSKPLTQERLFAWHSALFPKGMSGIHKITVASWRGVDADPMRVVSGHFGKEKVHFVAPRADRLEKEMKLFLDWFAKKENTDPVMKAGIAHLWFESIHPFEDGNGRIGRTIADMALAHADAMKERFYSLSSQIEVDRKHYYNQLEKQQHATLNITNWLSWFLDCLGRAIDNSESTLSHVLFKAHLWRKINQNPVNERQRLIINRMLEDDFKGFMNTSKYAKMAKCSNDTALRDIQELKERGVFIQNPGGGRSVSYRLTDQKNYS